MQTEPLSFPIGLKLLQQDKGLQQALVYVSLLLGVIAHWLYVVVVAGIKANGVFDFGSIPLIAAHLFVSFVASVPAYLSAYQTLSTGNGAVRFGSAFVAGLGVDALVSPWTASVSTPG